jgi:NAD(P)-dependent dehydrogenase (short-subunit alcohol dehydrogenase family)
MASNDAARALKGKVALVTGAGRGLGRAFAERLARLGADVAIHGMRENGPLDRIATVDEVARVVEFFAGPQGAFVSGQVLRVDGGGQCWPG